MKKIIKKGFSTFMMLISLFSLCSMSPNYVFEFEGEGCSASLNCSCGDTISCSGTSTCQTGSSYISCDGNVTYC